MDLLLHPQLSLHVQSLVRSGYGLCLLLYLIEILPVARWFLVSERWGGYAKSGPLVDVIQNPISFRLILTLWMACAAALIGGIQPVLAAFINLMLCRYFFIHMRWKGILRGGGAPGFMSYWWAAVLFLVELSGQHDPTHTLRPMALLTAKADLALIMLSSGLYKALAGYPRNEGMELGVVNPWWGYWWKFYKGIAPGSLVFRGMNHLAYMTEIVAALMMLFPPTQLLGGLLIFVSFVFIWTHIRLGFLTEMVMLTALLLVESGTPADLLLRSIPCPPEGPSTWFPTPPALVIGILRAGLATYLILLVPAHAGLYYNFLARRRLPRPLQTALERYTNFFGIIIWRVFTIDVINFFVRLHVLDRATGRTREYTEFRYPTLATRFRYWQVSEFICLASIFTTLKYYPDDPMLFKERLLRYARTVPHGPGELLRFEYFSIRKGPQGFDFVAVAEFDVEPEGSSVEERQLDPTANIRSGHHASPVHAGARPGSYAPATGKTPTSKA